MSDEQKKSRGRPTRNLPAPMQIVTATIGFLKMMVTDTVAKRIVTALLIAMDCPIPSVVELSGTCERSVREVRKLVCEGDLDRIYRAKTGGGRHSKTKGIEEEIFKELDANNYHTRKQIAEMIKVKFDMTMSLSAVGRLLKKRGTSG